MVEAPSYPPDLAARVREVWPSDAAPLPAWLETILDVAYHASFLRDEERPITCRLIFVTPSELPTTGVPPSALLPLAFEPDRPFVEDELRRLAPSAPTHRSLVAVCPKSHRIWGIVQSGPRWLHVAQGGRAPESPMPPFLVVRVVRPGHLVVGCGNRVVAELRGGHLSNVTLDVFQSRWMPERFLDARRLMAREHAESEGPSLDETSATSLTGFLAQQMLKRVVSSLQAAHHGGTLLVGVPQAIAERHIDRKYAFADTTARRRFRTLALEVLDLVARLDRVDRPVRAFYRESSDPRLFELDEALFELGHLIAALAETDGAVVLTKRFEILGFGAEIGGDLPVVSHVRRALDLEATEFTVEPVDGVGTRHRSAYRIITAAPDALAIVVSQDGSARFVACHEGALTYWDHGLGSF